MTAKLTAIDKIRRICDSEESYADKIQKIHEALRFCPVKPNLKTRTLKDIEKQIKQHTGISIEQINEETRRRSLITFRQMAQYKACLFTTHSFEEIGRYFGGKTKATVIHSRHVIETLLQTNREFREKYGEFLCN